VRQHQFDTHILREYDIRGTVNKNLNSADALEVGRRFGTWVKQQGEKFICLGRDGRLSSPDLHAHLTQGLIEAGLTIFDIGVGPTPMLYFSTKITPAFAGIMITGSHNPKDDNGFKITLKETPFFGEKIRGLATQPFIKSDQPGEVEHIDVRSLYIERLVKDYEVPNKRLKLAWDPGNGAAGEIIEFLTQFIEADHIVINAKIDGNFPNHHPDPSVDRNLEQLRAVIAEHNCDAGIAFDGDADRLGILDQHGRAFVGDQLLMVFAADVLKKLPGAKIIGDVKTSQAFYEMVSALGGQALMCRTGHSFIKVMTYEEKAVLAGEVSGHLFFADQYYGYDDAIYAAIRFINILQASNQTCADIYEGLPHYYSTPELRIECPDEIKFKVIEDMKADFKAQDLTFLDIDGLRYEDEHGWWLIRASNTQPALVGRCESKTPEGLEVLKHHLSLSLRKFYNEAEF
jgi:phosphomannomutase